MLYVRTRDKHVYEPLHVVPPNIIGLTSAIAGKCNAEPEKVSQISFYLFSSLQIPTNNFSPRTWSKAPFSSIFILFSCPGDLFVRNPLLPVSLPPARAYSHLQYCPMCFRQKVMNPLFNLPFSFSPRSPQT